MPRTAYRNHGCDSPRISLRIPLLIDSRSSNRAALAMRLVLISRRRFHLSALRTAHRPLSRAFPGRLSGCHRLPDCRAVRCCELALICEERNHYRLTPAASGNGATQLFCAGYSSSAMPGKSCCATGSLRGHIDLQPAQKSPRYPQGNAQKGYCAEGGKGCPASALWGAYVIWPGFVAKDGERHLRNGWHVIDGRSYCELGARQISIG